MNKQITDTLNRVHNALMPKTADLTFLLSLKTKEEQQILFRFADQVRQKHCGKGILLRGIIEFSNRCANPCPYCGLSFHNHSLSRYQLSKNEILDTVDRLHHQKIRTVILQSGEDPQMDPDWLADVIRSIRARFEMAITLSVGEKSLETYRCWKKAGADRYLLKIETASRSIYDSLHPGMNFSKRILCLKNLTKLGYQVGCGNMIGLIGQTTATIARDIQFFKKMDFDMIAIGPFIPHSKTPHGQEKPGDPELVLRTLALTRIVTKNSHLPSTTALASFGNDLKNQGFLAGANVLMLNFTPPSVLKDYDIYPGRKYTYLDENDSSSSLHAWADSLNRIIDYSIGNSLKSATTQTVNQQYI
ncbi:MAG: [FeFe] hydrogenase H-cluster radical SAM maturase HydE [Candidatus Aureabacteria bacterium]|nr:[FeFe] hydrogenase H-cluster radical SAM maturase HydE [Candidatus Auribacterota bacterium]